MARKFTRRRWRRPERMTLEAPPVSRRKNIGPPDILMLEPDLQQRAAKRRYRTMGVVFLIATLAEGAVVALLAHVLYAMGIVFLLGVVYLIAASVGGSGWLLRALGAERARNLRVNQFTSSLAATGGIGAPAAFVVRDQAMNAVAIDAGLKAVLVTTGSLNADDLVLEGMMAHEIAHLRDGDAAVGSRYAVLVGVHEVMRRVPILAVFLLLWPASLVVRALRSVWFGPDSEHRADVAAALLTRYPPGLASALRTAHGAKAPGPRSAAGLWFAPVGEDRARLIDEM